MWDEARSLFQVGTVAGVQRKWPKPVWCGVSTRFGNAWVSASIIGRGLTIKQEQKIAAFGSSYIWDIWDIWDIWNIWNIWGIWDIWDIWDIWNIWGIWGIWDIWDIWDIWNIWKFGTHSNVGAAEGCDLLIF
jgi:hypothetical protein